MTTERKYELVPDWARLPDGWTMAQTAIATDSDDRVYLFNRSAHPMLILERDGTCVASWGEGRLTSAHGLFIDADEDLYLPLISSHVVLKCDRSGNVLMTLGTWNEPSDALLTDDFAELFQHPVERVSPPFTLPTDVAVASDGTIFVRTRRDAALILGPTGHGGAGRLPSPARYLDPPRLARLRGRPREQPNPDLRSRGYVSRRVARLPISVRPVHR
jgi:hypothetical protein